MSAASDIREQLKTHAHLLGFDACGVAATGRLSKQEAALQEWLGNGYHGSLSYMERNLEKRLDPRLLLPGARSVIVVAKNYYPDQTPSAGRLNFSKYATGVDYHYVIKEQLDMLIEWLHNAMPGTISRRFTDSAPVLERTWAQKAGLGWTGKNSCLILPGKGSFYFIGEIVTTALLPPDQSYEKEHCGNCSRCMEACPTGAIVAPGVLDARKCISYLTIELKAPLSKEESDQCKGWAFGCDTCQDVCPHNKKAGKTNESRFAPLPPFMEWGEEDWKNMNRSVFRKHFVKAGSPLARTGFNKLSGHIRQILS